MDLIQKRAYKRELKAQGKKACSRCSTVYLITDFDFKFNKNGTHLYRSDCKQCRAIYKANYYKNRTKTRSK